MPQRGPSAGLAGAIPVWGGIGGGVAPPPMWSIRRLGRRNPVVWGGIGGASAPSDVGGPPAWPGQSRGGGGNRRGGAPPPRGAVRRPGRGHPGRARRGSGGGPPARAGGG